MISNVFYNKANLVQDFFSQKVLHFPAKDKSVSVEWREYVLTEGETLYSLAAKLFGKNLDYMWTYIADNNPLIHPDAWQSGDIIKLPQVIIRDTDSDTTLKKK